MTSHLARPYCTIADVTYLDAHEAERALVCREALAELVELDADCLAHDLVAVEVEHGPINRND